MRFTIRRFVPCLAFACLALGGAPLRGQPPAGQIDNQVDNNQVSGRFRSVPSYVPAYPAAGFYGLPYNGGLGGYMSGTADLVDSQGQFMVSQQKAFLMNEQWKQKKIDTRRKTVDEYLYERAVMPTLEDERERSRIEALRRSRNDPPLTEIWSGKALNDLLTGIQQQHAKGLAGPTVPVSAEILDHINVTGTLEDSSIGMLRDGGKLSWPLTLQGQEYEAERTSLDKLSGGALSQAGAGRVDADTLNGMTAAANALTTKIRENMEDISPNDYIKAKRFLNDLKGTIAALQDPNVANIVSHKWSAKGDNVGDLTREMTRQGLRFARASDGDQAAYTALHRAFVAYYAGPDSSWDALRK